MNDINSLAKCVQSGNGSSNGGISMGIQNQIVEPKIGDELLLTISNYGDIQKYRETGYAYHNKTKVYVVSIQEIKEVKVTLDHPVRNIYEENA